MPCFRPSRKVGGYADHWRVVATYYPNPQTAAFCSMLEIENKVDAPYTGGGGGAS